VSWLARNWVHIADLTRQHVVLALVPVVIGLVVAVPLGWLSSRSAAVRGTLLSVSGVLYTIPSLALIVVLPGILGTKILNPINVIAALSIYAAALLVRSVTDALAAVPERVVAAATAMGYRPVRRFFTVELPLVVPLVVAGLRVAAVSSISLVSVGALIGVGGLGELFTDGFQLDFVTPIIAGIVGSIALALVTDGVLLLIGRVLTPWARAGRRA
jgi:osmoprotectant transport system permease protein